MRGATTSRRLACLALLSAATLAGDKLVAEFRLKKDPLATVRGWIVEYDDSGFRFQRFGDARRLALDWDDLVEEDRGRIRRELKLELSEDEMRGLVDGHRLHLEGGGTVEGLLVRVDEEERHWMRQEGFLFPYPGDRIAEVEEIKVEESAVYDEEEVYARRMERIRPSSARQHRELAEYLADMGHFQRARQHLAEAIRLRPDWEIELRERLRELEELLADATLVEFLGKLRIMYRLRKDFAGARAELARFADEHPEYRRAALSALDDLEQREQEHLGRRFQIVKHAEFRRAVDDYLRRRKPEMDEALDWVRKALHAEVLRRTAERLGLSEEQAAELAKAPRTGAPHWASYHTGTFVVSKRAKKGASTTKAVRGDPDRWWAAYESAGRGAFLRAYAAERLPDLFEVVQVRLTDCEKCGGTGQVKHASLTELQGTGHEWSETCPRCFGAKRDRAVGYR